MADNVGVVQAETKERESLMILRRSLGYHGNGLQQKVILYIKKSWSTVSCPQLVTRLIPSDNRKSLQQRLLYGLMSPLHCQIGPKKTVESGGQR